MTATSVDEWVDNRAHNAELIVEWFHAASGRRLVLDLPAPGATWAGAKLADGSPITFPRHDGIEEAESIGLRVYVPQHYRIDRRHRRAMAMVAAHVDDCARSLREWGHTELGTDITMACDTWRRIHRVRTTPRRPR